MILPFISAIMSACRKCLRELERTHADGTDHYHACVKLSVPKRWLSPKNYLSRNFNVRVHFSDNHDNYYQEYKYVTTSDTVVYHSLTHLNLDDIAPPRIAGCVSGQAEAGMVKRKASLMRQERVVIPTKQHFSQILKCLSSLLPITLRQRWSYLPWLAVKKLLVRSTCQISSSYSPVKF